MPLACLRIRLELKLIEPMYHNPCTLLVQHFLGEVRHPGGAQVEHREAGLSGRQDAAVDSLEALQGGFVKMIHEARLRIHGRVVGLVHPREVLPAERPGLGRPTVLRVEGQAHGAVRVGLLKKDRLPSRPRDLHADEVRLLDHLAQDRLPGLGRPVSPGVRAVARDAVAQEEVGDLANLRGELLVPRPHAPAQLEVLEGPARLVRGQAGLLGGLAEHRLVGDVLRLLEVQPGDGVHHLALEALPLRRVDEAERVERVHDAAVGVELHAHREALEPQRVVLRVSVLLGVAVIAQEVVVEALALLGDVRVQEDRVVANRRKLVEAEILQRLLQVQVTDVREGAADVREDVDDELLGLHRLVQCRREGLRLRIRSARERDELRQFLKVDGVGKLHAGLGGHHELAEGLEALAHGDVHVAVVHHGVPPPGDGAVLEACRGRADCVPGHVPEVAVVEARDARRPGAQHGVTARDQGASRVDRSEGAHLDDHGVVRDLRHRDLAVPIHDQEAGTLRLRGQGRVALVRIHLLVEHRDEVRVDVPGKPVVAEVALGRL
mmetsp:Transcript_2519/g.7504  ORF Transcript_2519/g.7504 Transcript_2519/m.7504 type:complete len:550 (+) Transcript_2519:639-2288(+)